MFAFWSFIHSIEAFFIYYYPNAVYLNSIKYSHNKVKVALGESKANNSVLETNLQIQTPIFKADNYMLVTGILAMALCTIVLITSLPIIRKKYYEVFYYIHHLFIGIVIATILHAGIPKFRIVAIIIYCLHKLINIISIKKYSNKEIYIRRISENSIMLQLPRKKKTVEKYTQFNPEFGKYIFLCCPQISKFQWHAFDLSGTKSDNINYDTLIISTKGRWTNKLHQMLVKEKLLRPNGSPGFTLLTTRHFHSAHSYILENDVVILVAGGVGISPMIPIIDEYLSDSSSKNSNYKSKKIYLIWICRDLSLVSLVAETVSKYYTSDIINNFSIKVYYTGKTVIYDLNFQVLTIFQNQHIAQTYAHKPDIYKVYTEIIKKYEKSTNVGVCSVGSKELTSYTKAMSVKWGRENGMCFRMNYYKASLM
ncbi:hypothetical protein BB561_002473 [Smittium simulii]|uniref:FAD-binding FR-type domain-containing protein n=1 Tax=Smittium simulii TaxID=133385 RepID=A0A2T9YQA2_9FUNG|nr:hypothetical protein BB561_002473 [Smittium simulii]